MSVFLGYLMTLSVSHIT